MSSTTQHEVVLVNRGSQSWTVIDRSAPSIKTNASWANAMPVDVSDIETPALQPNRLNWRLLRHTQYGSAAVDIGVRVLWRFGSRQRGGGAFISRMWVEVPTCEVRWGFDVRLSVRILPTRNVGSAAAPIAEIPISMCGSITTPLGIESLDWRVGLRGDGSTTAWASDAR